MSLSGFVVALLLLALPGWAAPAGSAPTPAYRLELSGESRTRFEHLDGQFRAGRSGSDRIVAMRTLAHAELTGHGHGFALEIQDARSYGADRGTPLSPGIVNPLDVLQAYFRVGSDDAQTRGFVKAGRMTLDVGSGRQVERVDFANVILSYTGVYGMRRTAHGHEVHAFYVVPVDRRPQGFDDLQSNRLEADREAWRRRFGAVHYRHVDAAGPKLPGLDAEAFLYGLHERDDQHVPTPNRRYVTAGFRLSREPVPGRWDLDLEGALRLGSRRETSQPADTRDLDVRAGMLHAALGYTFQDSWRTRLAIDFDFASGDRRPGDDRYDQYERLFGSRRTDLGNTGIHGPLTPANIRAPGARVEISPTDDLDARLAWKAASLASARDSWVVARLRDPDGRSGRLIGHALDGRVRYWLRRGSVRAEFGASALLRRRFAERVPGGPGAGATVYVYGQLTFVL